MSENMDDMKCEFRTGKNAKYADAAVDTEAVFNKAEFVKLYNESAEYDPVYLRDHLDECDLKINAEDQPAEWDKIFGSEISIKAVYGEDSSEVSIYRYDSRLYFFVLSMGGKSKPDEKGHYYIELSEEMDTYWRPIIDQVLKDAAKEN